MFLKLANTSRNEDQFVMLDGIVCTISSLTLNSRSDPQNGLQEDTGYSLVSGYNLYEWAYMNDTMTTQITTVPCTKRLLEKLHQNITWTRMMIKPSKCGNISVVKRQITDQIFDIDKIPVPTVSEIPVKSLG